MNITDPVFGNIPIDLIRPSKTNPRKRFDEASLAELARTISQSGVGQPILVRPLPDVDDDVPHRVEIVAGERRYRASKIAGMTVIPAIVREMTDSEVLSFQLVENLQREDVHPIEEAEGYERLMKQYNYTADECADKVGKSRSYIYSRLKFCALAPEARTSFYEGKLNASTALLVARIPVPALQIKAADEIARGHGTGESMSYRKAMIHVQSRYMLDLSGAPFSIKDVKLVAEAGACIACPKRTGNQPELFTDIDSADVCTDPDCFSAKKKAHHEIIFVKAQKKGIPVHDSKSGTKLLQEDHATGASAMLCHFERPADKSNQYSRLDKLLTPEEMPAPIAYIKRDDGEMSPIFDKTAIQLALEKAGLCQTLEQHTAAMREKLERGDNDDGEAPLSEKVKERRAMLDEKQRAVDLERSIRLTLYKKAREAAADEGVRNAMLRIAAKSFVGGELGSLSDDIASLYSCNMGTDDEIKAYLDQCTADETMLFLTDLAVNYAIDVNSWELDHLDPDEPSYCALMDMATAAGIDVDQVRAELTPKPVEETPQPDTAPAEQAAGTGKKKAIAKMKAPEPEKETVTMTLEEWPFPTGARP